MSTKERQRRPRGRRMTAAATSVVAASAVMIGLGSATAPAAAHPQPTSGMKGGASGDVVRGATLDPAAADEARRGHYTNTGHIGDVVAWPAYQEDDQGSATYYLKDFTLRGVGPHLEVWVARGDDVSTGLDFPAGDCRNGQGTTSVTDSQVGYLIDEFEKRIRPREATVFGTPDKRDGRNALLPSYVSSIPAGAYRGPGDRTVVLVDNFRRASFRDVNAQIGPLNGLVDDVQMSYVDRNVVNVSGLAWSWRLGPQPLAERATHDPCTEVWTRHNWIEGVLAHEYNHVLQASAGENAEAFYNDPSWLDEGLAVWATHLVGYMDPAVIDDRNDFVECFLGYNYLYAPSYMHRCPGGPAKSLTSFYEVGQPPAVDYGAAESFMEFLDGRYGHDFMGDLLRTVGVWGMDKVTSLLAQRGVSATFDDLVSDWSAAMALDGVLDDGATLTGGDASHYQVPSMHAGITWESPFAYGRPAPLIGVSPNATQYVRLRDGVGQWLNASDLRSLDFDGDTRLDCRWVVDADGHGSGDAALYSGGFNNGQNRDLAIPADVPESGATLDFDTRYETEQGWDFGYVQVSDDNGATWHSLPATTTTTDHSAQAFPAIIADLPGFTGSSGGWVHEHADLSAWKGRHVLIGFRYRTDPGLAYAGFWVDNVTVGTTLLSDGSTLDGWQQLAPLVHRLVLRLVSYTDDHRVARIANVPLDSENDAHLDAAELATLVAPGAQTVSALVTQLQSDPNLFCAVLYSLAVNGVTQPGG